MQPDDEADDLHALLHEEYGAPPLDDQFSADLLARLKAEIAPAKSPKRAQEVPSKSSPAICLGIGGVAALIIAVIWISQLGSPAKDVVVAQPGKTDLQREELRALSDEAQERHQDERARDPGTTPRSLSASHEHESMPLHESLSAPGESKPYLESKSQPKESRAHSESKPKELSGLARFSVLDVFPKEWPSISATGAHAGLLYVVDSGHLYEVNPRDGSRRVLGNDDWQGTTALSAMGESLYLVCDDRLFEVNSKTGVRRGLGKPEWADTNAIMAVGNKLYIACGGHLYRVDPSDGSYEVLHTQIPKP